MRTPQTSRGLESIRRMRAARWLVLAGPPRPRAGRGKDLADFARRAGLTAEREAQLRAGAAAVLAAGPLARE